MSSEIKKYVLGFLFSPNKNSVVLIRKTKPFWQAGKLNGVGGKIELGETPDQAMRREFKEETGLQVNAWYEFCQLSGHDFMMHVYTAVDERFYSASTMTDEEVVIIPVNLVNRLTTEKMSNLSWLIPMALGMDNDRASHYACWATYNLEAA